MPWVRKSGYGAYKCWVLDGRYKLSWRVRLLCSLCGYGDSHLILLLWREPELSTVGSLCLLCLPTRANPAHRVSRIQISLRDPNRGYGVMPMPTALF